MPTTFDLASLTTTELSKLWRKYVELDNQVRQVRYDYIPKTEESIAYYQSYILRLACQDEPWELSETEFLLTNQQQQLGHLRGYLATLQARLDKLNAKLFPTPVDEDDEIPF